MSNNLQHQKVVVAGGSSGIGLATARLLLEQQAHVTITGRDAAKLEKVKKETPALNVVQLDSQDTNALQQFFADQGPFHHLVLALSSAKGGGPFATLPLDDLRAGFEGKFWPQLQTLQAALPYLQKDGSVTFITATSSSARLPGTSGLAALNGALEIMVPILAKELQPLRVNAVSPGVIDTEWWSFLDEQSKKALFADYSKQVAVGRIGKAPEVAAAIAGIINNGYVNGSVLHCNGGLA